MVTTAFRSATGLARGALSHMRTARARMISILMYHSVSSRCDPYTVTPETFAHQIRFVCDNFPVIPLDRVPKLLESDQALRRHVVVTFDDAYTNFLTSALPILNESKVPSTLFVPTAYIGGVNEWDLTDTKGVHRTILNSDEICSLSEMSRVQIGSHGVRHVRLSGMSPEEMDVEALESKRSLESLLGKPVTAFAYPYGQLGDFTDVTTKALERAGYQLAVTTHWGTMQSQGDLLRLHRIRFWEEDSEQDLRARIEGLDDWRTLKERLGAAYRRVRRMATPNRAA